MPSAGDTPGWQPDPARPGMLRWWNGLGWSDAYRSPEQLPEHARRAMAEARSVTAAPRQEVQRREQEARRVASTAAPTIAAGRAGASAVVTNTLGAAAIATGVIGLLFGFGGILSLLALLLSLRGIARSRRLAAQGAQRTGLPQSLVGLLVSVAGLIRGAPQLFDLVGQIANG